MLLLRYSIVKNKKPYPMYCVNPYGKCYRIYEYIVSANGQSTIHYYIKGRQIGKGGFATCYEIIKANSSYVYAGKLIPIPKYEGQRSGVSSKTSKYLYFKNEIKVLYALRHPGIVKYYRNFSDVNYHYILFELCRNGTIQDLQRKRRYLSEPYVRYYLLQLVPILQYLQSKQVIHRDIKMANLMLDDNMNIKLGDFGLATFCNYDVYQNRRRTCGTPNYIAPEVINKKYYSFSVDIWSVGVTIYTMLMGRTPFYKKTLPETYDTIRRCYYSFESTNKDIKLSLQAKTLIQAIFNTDPSARATLDEIIRHPFLTDFEIPAVLTVSIKSFAPTKEFLKKYNTCKVGSEMVVRGGRSKSANQIHMDGLYSTGEPNEASQKILATKDVCRMTIPEKEFESIKNLSFIGEVYQLEYKVLPKKRIIYKIKRYPIVQGYPIVQRYPIFQGYQIQPAGGIETNYSKSRTLTANIIISYRSNIYSRYIPSGKSNPPLNFKIKPYDIIDNHFADNRVVDWIDVRHRFGVAYVFYCGIIGVMYNDGTQIVSRDYEMYYIVGGRLIRKIVMKETDEDKGIVGKKQLFVQYMVKLYRRRKKRRGNCPERVVKEERHVDEDNEKEKDDNQLLRGRKPIYKLAEPKITTKAALSHLVRYETCESFTLFKLYNGSIQFSFSDSCVLLFCSSRNKILFLDYTNQYSIYRMPIHEHHPAIAKSFIDHLRQAFKYIQRLMGISSTGQSVMYRNIYNYEQLGKIV